MSDPSPTLYHDRKAPKSYFLGVKVSLESSSQFRTMQNQPLTWIQVILVRWCPQAPENTSRSLASNYFYK